jgi:hypothetical protein
MWVISGVGNMKKMVYVGGDDFYDRFYIKEKVYEVKESDDIITNIAYKVWSETRVAYYHPFKRLFREVDDACDKCSSNCRSKSSKCGLYSE